MYETWQGWSGTNVPRFNIYRSIISLSEITSSNVAWPPIQSKKEEVKNSREGEGEGWKQQKEGLDKILKRWGRKYRVGLHNMGKG